MSTSDRVGAADEPSRDEGAGRDVSEEAIRRRAYEISQGADAGTAEENWERAERELNAEH